MVDRDLLEAADNNMVVAWRGLVSLSPSPRVVEEGDMVLMASGVPIPLFNPVFVASAPPDPAATVRRVLEHYGALASPFVLYFHDETAPGLAAACEAAGLVEHFRPPLMVLDPIPASPPPPQGLEISVVDETTVAGYGDVLAAGFGMPRDLVDLVLGPPLLAVDGFTAFLATIDGEPVGTSGLFVAAGLAGVYNVATAPAARGKGVGAAITWAAAAAGAAAGCTRSILQSSAEGEPVYRRMGYGTLTVYRQFEPPQG